jgi:mannosylglycoprotein endo-beta-mannosidase
VVAHEIVHSLHKTKEKGVVLKLDYEKTYDRVSWDFMFEVLESRGFDSK